MKLINLDITLTQEINNIFHFDLGLFSKIKFITKGERPFYI